MKRFKDILCVIEPDKIWKPVLERAVSLAENNQAALTVVNVVPRVAADINMPDGGPISNALQTAIVEDQQKQLDEITKPYHKQLKIGTRVLVGTPFLQIIREVLRNSHDLVIKIPEQQDWLDRVFGSNDMHLLRKCPCPVWLVKSQAPKTYRRILAAVDVGDTPREEQEATQAMNHQILELASSLALSDFAELHIAHAWDAPGETTLRGGFMRMTDEKVIEYVDGMRRSHAEGLDSLMRAVANSKLGDALNYLKPKKHLERGWARKVIPALAKRIDADLIVMGTVARTGVPGFIMGNTAETILNQIDCSVLAVKPSGFVTPITDED